LASYADNVAMKDDSNEDKATILLSFVHKR
jgi:hypothetical protein